MRKVTCASCSTEFPMGQIYQFGNQTYCGPCAERTVQANSSLQGKFEQLIDPTVCSNCGADWGNSELPKIAGKLPFCPPCKEKVYNFEFPAWLKGGLAFCLILLIFALAHGAKYYRLGRGLYRGQHRLEQKQLRDAIEDLAPVAAAAPECEKCVLLTVKAYLLNGQPDKAFAVAKTHHDGRFKQSDELADVSSLFNKAEKSAQLLDDAGKMYQQHKEEDALKLVDEAATAYPEWQAPKDSASAIKVGMAFDRQDYDGFLALAEDYQKDHPKDMTAVAQLSSALACKYAVTGDQNFRQNSETMLAQAKDLATSDEEKKYFTEYSERIHHRLESREIISKDEYDRRFRSQQGAQK